MAGPRADGAAPAEAGGSRFLPRYAILGRQDGTVNRAGKAQARCGGPFAPGRLGGSAAESRQQAERVLAMDTAELGVGETGARQPFDMMPRGTEGKIGAEQ